MTRTTVVSAVIRTRTLLAALLTTLLLTPLASAQTTPVTGILPSSSLTVDIQPMDTYVTENVQAIQVHGLYSVPAGVSLSAIDIHFEIESAPAWALASLAPATVSVQVQPLSGGLVATVPFTTRILIASTDAPEGALGEVRLFAWTHGGGTAGPGQALESVIVRAEGEKDCHHATNATAAASNETAEPTLVEAQSASIGSMPATGPVVGGLALVGAAGGGAYVLRRKP